MRKLKIAMFNVFLYANVIFALASMAYNALPEQYKFLQGVPFETILISGVSTGLIGSVGLYYKSSLMKHSLEFDRLSAKILEQLLVVKKDDEKTNERVVLLEKQMVEFIKSQRRTVELLEADLKIKRDDELISERAKRIAEVVLNEK